MRLLRCVELRQVSFLTKALFSTAIFPTVAFSAFAQISEISGSARFEAEKFTSSTNTTISSVIYEWTIANDIALSNTEPPGRMVTVSLPALMICGSSSPS